MSIYGYRFPELGEGIHEGEIVKLFIHPGDSVTDETILMEVQNDKAVVEVPCPVEGQVVEVFVKEGQICTVGQIVAHIEVKDAGVTPSHPQTISQESVEQPVTLQKHKENTENSETESDFSLQPSRSLLLATPHVRKLARDRGISLHLIPPTGKHGHITREDVLRFIKSESESTNVQVEADSWLAEEKIRLESSHVTAHEKSEERVPFKGIRKIIAKAMSKSMYTAPHVTLMDEVEVSHLVKLREKAKAFASPNKPKLTYLPFIVKAMSHACREFPIMNAMLDEDKQEIVYKKYIHVGIATDTDQGLVVPVIPQADKRTLWEIAESIQDLSRRAREGKLDPQEMRGSTITITNIGSIGGLFFTPIIHYPEVAILGIGRISEKPIVRESQIVVGSVMALSLSFDHRLVDGATAQAFLNTIKRYVEDPTLLILEV